MNEHITLKHTECHHEVFVSCTGFQLVMHFHMQILWEDISWSTFARRYSPNLTAEPQYSKKTLVHFATTASVMVQDVMQARIFDTSHEQKKYSSEVLVQVSKTKYSGSVTAHRPNKPQMMTSRLGVVMAALQAKL